MYVFPKAMKSRASMKYSFFLTNLIGFLVETVKAKNKKKRIVCTNLLVLKEIYRSLL